MATAAVGVECPICMDNYSTTGRRIPKLLFCGHTVCQFCLNNLLLGNRLCPACRETIPSNTEFKINFALRDSLEYVNTLEQEKTDLTNNNELTEALNDNKKAKKLEIDRVTFKNNRSVLESAQNHDKVMATSQRIAKLEDLLQKSNLEIRRLKDKNAWLVMDINENHKKTMENLEDLLEKAKVDNTYLTMKNYRLSLKMTKKLNAVSRKVVKLENLLKSSEIEIDQLKVKNDRLVKYQFNSLDTDLAIDRLKNKNDRLILELDQKRNMLFAADQELVDLKNSNLEIKIENNRLNLELTQRANQLKDNGQETIKLETWNWTLFLISFGLGFGFCFYVDSFLMSK